MFPLWQVALVSILPGLLWLWFFYRRDVFEPEPRLLLLLLFGLGMLAVLPAWFLELPWRGQLLRSIGRDPGRLVLLSFLVVGGFEETAKFLFLLVPAYFLDEFDEPLDGIIYGITVGLGFAALENILYAAARGPAVGLFRAVVTSLAHASFTGWLGYFVSLAKFRREPPLLPLGWLIAVALHGAYDSILLGFADRASFLSFALVGGAVFLLLAKMRELEAISPFRPPGPV